MTQSHESPLPVPVRTFRVGPLDVTILESDADLGKVAARTAAEIISASVARNGTARVVLGTGNSQLPFVRALVDQDAPWGAVTVFHLDEYVGVPADHQTSFRRWIRENISEPLGPGVTHFINGDAPSIADECRRYEQLLREAPLDLVCVGIGENGHIAFNEPHQTDFSDAEWVKVVRPDERTRAQQVGEGHFAAVSDVPEVAVTLTVPALLSGAALVACVPELRKAEAVRATLSEPVSPAVPATALRTHPSARLLLDTDSASLLSGRR